MTIDDINDSYRKIMEYKTKLVNFEEEANGFNK